MNNTSGHHNFFLVQMVNINISILNSRWSLKNNYLKIGFILWVNIDDFFIGFMYAWMFDIACLSQFPQIFQKYYYKLMYNISSPDIHPQPINYIWWSCIVHFVMYAYYLFHEYMTSTDHIHSLFTIIDEWSIH